MVRKKKDTLYKFAKVKAENGPELWTFTVYKLNEDYDVLSTYTTQQISANGWVCSCPAWKSPCKHVKIATRIIEGEAGPGLSWMYSLNQDNFVKPTAQPDQEELD